MKEVKLDKNGRISLVCFLGILLLQPIVLTLAKFGICFEFRISNFGFQSHFEWALTRDVQTYYFDDKLFIKSVTA